MRAHLSLDGGVRPAMKQRHDGAECCMQTRERVAERDVGPHGGQVGVAIEVPLSGGAPGRGTETHEQTTSNY